MLMKREVDVWSGSLEDISCGRMARDHCDHIHVLAIPLASLKQKHKGIISSDGAPVGTKRSLRSSSSSRDLAPFTQTPEYLLSWKGMRGQRRTSECSISRDYCNDYDTVCKQRLGWQEDHLRTIRPATGAVAISWSEAIHITVPGLSRWNSARRWW